MTNKNGSVVPAAQELETFLPVDTVNGVTKWVYYNIINKHFSCELCNLECSN